MAKVDLKKEWADLYSATNEVALVTVPAAGYLMVHGRGDLNTASSFQDAIQALYAAAYTLKLMLKAEPDAPDWVIMPLEALWWAEGGDLLSVQDVRRKKGDLPAIDLLRLAALDEGLRAQVLHLGTHSDPAPAIERLLA